MRSAYRILGYLVALGVVIQAASIAYAWFAVIGDLESGAVFDENSEGNAGHALHGMIGMMLLPLVSLVFLVVSFFAKVPGGLKWAGFVVLAVVVQVLLGMFAHGAPALGLLHGANALVLFGLAVTAGRRVGSTTRATARESALA